MSDAWVQAVYGPLLLLVVGWFLDRRSKTRHADIEAKVSETHHQVTVNHHSSATPTLLDRFDDLEQESRARFDGLEKDIRGIRDDHRDHIHWHLEH